MIAGSILFALCSVLCLAGALIVVLAKNPIRGAMGLFATIVGIAGLFLRLNAQFLAAMQLLVYAGAVVILFVFVVMLLGTDASLKESSTGSSKVSRLFSGVAVSVLGACALVLFSGSEWHTFEKIGPSHGSVEAVGTLMFTKALVPFELTTVLLIVAVVGALAVARTKPGLKKIVESQNQTERMFGGPLHPRDAERPLPRNGTAGSSLASTDKESAS